MEKIFISYSQKDRERVNLFASILAYNGFDIWMDTKSIPLGSSIISEISKGLDASDIYMIFISQNSSVSNWVEEEISLALTKNIADKKPRIIPVLLDNSPIPQKLRDRRYLDARESIYSALTVFISSIESDKTSSDFTSAPITPILSEVVFGLSKKSDISYGSPMVADFSHEDVIEFRDSMQKDLRKRANGILINFVSLADFDLQAPFPKFKNGVYDETIERVSGDFVGSISEIVHANATIFNPDEAKLKELVKTKLDKLSATSLTYVFSIPPQEEGFDRKCIKNIQDKYPIISYEYEEGATIEYDSNFFVSIKCSCEQIRIKIETEYQFQFSKHAVEFSPNEFVNWILKLD